MIQEIINYMKDELKIKISKNKELNLLEKFRNRTYEDSVYWYISVDERTITFFYDGLITKKEYEKIKTIDKNKNIFFGEIAKHCYADAKLHEIIFIEDEHEILKRMNCNQRNDFDLMEFLYVHDIISDDMLE